VRRDKSRSKTDYRVGQGDAGCNEVTVCRGHDLMSQEIDSRTDYRVGAQTVLRFESRSKWHYIVRQATVKEWLEFLGATAKFAAKSRVFYSTLLEGNGCNQVTVSRGCPAILGKIDSRIHYRVGHNQSC